MYPTEVWWLIDARRAKKIFAGGQSEDDVAELYDLMKDKGLL